MSSRTVPDDIVLRSFAVFRAGNRKYDDAAPYAVCNFITYIENGKLSFSKARQLLNDEAAIGVFIEENRETLRASEKRTLAQITLVNRELLERTHANSEKTLNGQDAMRAEFKGLIDELYSSVKVVGTVTEENAQTSADIRAATAENEATAKVIATQIAALGAASEDIHAEVKKAVKNTSTATAVLVGMGVGFLAGLPTNYVYERHFSIGEMNKKADAAHKDKDTVGASAPPPPDKDAGTSLVALPYNGLVNPLTGKSVVDLFNEGHSVKLLKQDGSSICLQMPKLIPCVGAEVPKPQPNATVALAKPDKVVTQRQPARHFRRHHL